MDHTGRGGKFTVLSIMAELGAAFHRMFMWGFERD
jgi:hypothetical protein